LYSILRKNSLFSVRRKEFLVKGFSQEKAIKMIDELFLCSKKEEKWH